MKHNNKPHEIVFTLFSLQYATQIKIHPGPTEVSQNKNSYCCDFFFIAHLLNIRFSFFILFLSLHLLKSDIWFQITPNILYGIFFLPANICL